MAMRGMTSSSRRAMMRNGTSLGGVSAWERRGRDNALGDVVLLRRYQPELGACERGAAGCDAGVDARDVAAAREDELRAAVVEFLCARGG